jgi:hypothetical protein
MSGGVIGNTSICSRMGAQTGIEGVTGVGMEECRVKSILSDVLGTPLVVKFWFEIG